MPPREQFYNSHSPAVTQVNEGKMSEQRANQSRSKHDVAETSRRLCAAAQSAGLLIFAEIDHGQNATDVGLQPRPARLIIFGNPRGGP
jgi:uncharacterized protein (DUF302 family)